MKKQIWILSFALPFLFVGCKPQETTREKLNTAPEKVATPVKSKAKAAGDEAVKPKTPAPVTPKADPEKPKDVPAAPVTPPAPPAPPVMPPADPAPPVTPPAAPDALPK